MRRAAWVVLPLFACTRGPDPDDTSADADADTDSDADADTDADLGDEDLARALIGGEGDLPDVLATVAARDGWPIATAEGTYLFVAEGTGWSLVGDGPGWDPGLAMAAGDGFSWVEATIATPEGSHYKFRRGADYVADPWARAHAHDEFGDVAFVEPPSTGWWLDRWPGIGGHGMDAREVNVFVPGPGGPYDVLYAHDGQNLFAWDPVGLPTSGWFFQDAVLAMNEPVIVVGIDNNGAERLDEYGHADEDLGTFTIDARADDYADFVTLDVKPFVEARYPVTSYAGVIGSSMGGLVSLWIGHRHPAEWDFVGAMSPSLFVGAVDSPGPTMLAAYEGASVRPFRVYLDSGGGDGGDGCTDPDGDGSYEDDPTASDNYCETRQFADRLAAHGYAWDTQLAHWHEPGAPHTEAAWADRLSRPLDFFR